MQKNGTRLESFMCWAGSLEKGNDYSVQVYFSRNKYIEDSEYNKLFVILMDYVEDPSYTYDYEIDAVVAFTTYLFNYNDSGELYVRIKNARGIQEVRYVDGVLNNCSLISKDANNEISVTSNEKGFNVQCKKVNQYLSNIETVNEANYEIGNMIQKVSKLYSFEKQENKGKARVKVGE